VCSIRDNKSLSRVLWIQIHENRKEKLPDRLADSCKHLSVNRMAAGSRVPRSSQGVFLLSSTFQTHFFQLTKSSQVFARPTGIQALPSPVNSTIIGILENNGRSLLCTTTMVHDYTAETSSMHVC